MKKLFATLKPMNKTVVSAIATILFWITSGITTGEWTPNELVEGAVVTFLVWLIPNTVDTVDTPDFQNYHQ